MEFANRWNMREPHGLWFFPRCDRVLWAGPDAYHLKPRNLVGRLGLS